MPPERLRLRAEDEADLQVLSACLQDALVPLADMIWLRDERRFAMVVNRFMWEAPAEKVDMDAGPVEVHNRSHGILSINKVRRVRTRGVDRRKRDRVLDLLAIRLDGESLHLDFAGGGGIRVDVDGIDCRLEDVGAPWPTQSKPSHADSGG